MSTPSFSNQDIQSSPTFDLSFIDSTSEQPLKKRASLGQWQTPPSQVFSKNSDSASPQFLTQADFNIPVSRSGSLSLQTPVVSYCLPSQFAQSNSMQVFFC